MKSLHADNSYTNMQRNQYESEADLMNEQNHMFHNANQDYWDILTSDTESDFRDKVGLDFGCGCGRNVLNLWYRFKRMDGVDISKGNLKHAYDNILKAGCPEERFRLHHCNGVDLSNLRDNEYDFIMSTIVLQHIAVHDIRYNYFKEFFRIMKEGGLLSFQMGFGEGYGKAGYYENHYHAEATNSFHDTLVTDPNQLIDELRKIGFSKIEYIIRDRFSDGHPSWIFVKAIKIKQKANLLIYHHPIDFNSLPHEKVSYQSAQFHHLKNFSHAIYSTSTADALNCNAVIVFDELTLLTDRNLNKLNLSDDQWLVYISHDYWCHPLKVAEYLKRHKNVLMILRHLSAKTLFDHLLPDVTKFVQRPGVEVSIFHPHDGVKKFDIIIGGSETPDYPLRQNINRVVREYQSKYNWIVLDITGRGLMSNPPGAQYDYAAALAASKISPTASNRGGSAGGKLAMQYFDLSPARAEFDHPFYGLKTPEMAVLEFNTAGITPRYLESLASKSLLIADLPASDFQNWYSDKMVVINERMSDRELAELFNYWIKNDKIRNEIVDHAYQNTIATETSLSKAQRSLQ